MSEAARFENGAVPVLCLTFETCAKPARRGLSQIRAGSRKVAEIVDQITLSDHGLRKITCRAVPPAQAFCH